MSPDLIRSLLPLIPAADDDAGPPVVLTLSKKMAYGNPDTRASAITVNGRRRPVSLDDAVGAGFSTTAGLAKWTIFNDLIYPGWQIPAVEDQLVDPEGAKFTIKNVKETALKVLYACVCVPEYSS